MARIKRKILHKLIVYGVSLTFIGVLATVFLFYQNKVEEERAAEAMEELESSFEEMESMENLQEAKPAMSQDEMEEIYEEHKDYDTQEEAALVYTSPVDFEGMWKINGDVYAWITIPGTEIDYPVLQHATDNSYYLNYNIDGSYGYPGCIYTENMNHKDFTDNNTVIYGHNMKNGTMFADLHKYKDETFLLKNDELIIYTPEKELKYTIFAAYVYDDRHLLYSFDFADSAVYENYLKTILSMRSMDAIIRDDIGVTKDDKIITLATCIASQPEKRLLVQAVLETGQE